MFFFSGRNKIEINWVPELAVELVKNMGCIPLNVRIKLSPGGAVGICNMILSIFCDFRYMSHCILFLVIIIHYEVYE